MVIKRVAAKAFVLILILMGLPLLGVWLAGFPPMQYLEFPPRTRYIEHAPFSPVAFFSYALFILCGAFFLAGKIWHSPGRKHRRATAVHPFPIWGFLGLGSGLLFWFLAWTRFSWFGAFQLHTFTPLWLSFIVVVNALAYRRTGGCLLLDCPLYFLSLFPASAVFWWFFEYLNRYVQNWYYTGVHFSTLEYILYASISFSTVLPAVASVHTWLTSFPRLTGDPNNRPAITRPFLKATAAIVLTLAGAGLLLIGIWPDYLFAWVWISPLLLVVGIQALSDGNDRLVTIWFGDWKTPASYALAALVCGFFWEMWNFYSLAKWQYSIPFVHTFSLFEMPLLGYAGYIPFGWECMVIITALDPKKRPSI